MFCIKTQLNCLFYVGAWLRPMPAIWGVQISGHWPGPKKEGGIKALNELRKIGLPIRSPSEVNYRGYKYRAKVSRREGPGDAKRGRRDGAKRRRAGLRPREAGWGLREAGWAGGRRAGFEAAHHGWCMPLRYRASQHILRDTVNAYENAPPNEQSKEPVPATVTHLPIQHLQLQLRHVTRALSVPAPSRPQCVKLERPRELVNEVGCRLLQSTMQRRIVCAHCGIAV
ncbi:hypothetical protein C8F04DRAFT_1184315 [Mycena alexandri]|uniref:Uncharacterized protein n=1 Tax=Mycena alexandri TaxID=1745969 RepID=A0AAD6STD3_9AGAR|nr:hypothetical protein C8F04DRAFT_1184315 [Mycena alexandri]